VWVEFVLPRAAEIVRSYDTPVTLRQVFYRLWSLPMDDPARLYQATDYTALANRSADAREDPEWQDGQPFPDLADHGRLIRRLAAWDSPSDAVKDAIDSYHRDRTMGQETAIYLGVEKEGLVAQLTSWFSYLGVPILCLRGYSSQTYTAVVSRHVAQDSRKSVLLYAGDLDADGEFILERFVEKTNFDRVIPVAVTREQIKEFDPPVLPGKATSKRAPAFTQKYGSLFQVETDALTPEQLRGLFQTQIDKLVNLDLIAPILEQEERDKKKLRGARRLVRGGFRKRVERAAARL
jgi:hypothetical protein